MKPLLLILFTSVSVFASESATAIFNTPVFKSGEDKTHTFRIPALITAPNGDLIAACDARRKSSRDLIWERDIDIVFKRSSDHGKNWSEMKVICDYGDGKPASDPSFILDRQTGEIHCFYNYMDQDNAPKIFRMYHQVSKDSGFTWSKAVDLTDSLLPPEWKKDFMFITSGRGIQTEKGELLHTLVNLKRKALYVFSSKDHGKKWKLLPTPVKPADESKIVELTDGSWMINSRVNGAGVRWVHRSNNLGMSWESAKSKDLIDPGCNGSIIRYTSTKDGYSKNRLLFSNCESSKSRKNLTVKISYDEGKTWSHSKVIDAGSAAYSSLTICKDGSIGILYEAKGYKEIRYSRLTLEELTSSADSLKVDYKL